MLDIWKVLRNLEITETEYRECKEELLRKEDSLYLYADWDELKKEKGISNQRQREAYIHECTQELREQVTRLQLERDTLKRTYTVLLCMAKHDVGVETIMR